jgi:hypothetical protein
MVLQLPGGTPNALLADLNRVVDWNLQYKLKSSERFARPYRKVVDLVIPGQL